MRKPLLIGLAATVASVAIAVPAAAAPLNWHQAFYPTRAACLDGARILRADGARVGTLPNGNACGRYVNQWYLNYAYPW